MPVFLSAGKGVAMGVFNAFLLSVGAGIISYYICKWLDRRENR